MRKRLKPLMI